MGGNATAISEFTATTGVGKDGVANRALTGTYGSFIYIGQSAAGVLAPGDRIRIQDSADEYQSFIVASTSEDNAFEIMGTFTASDTGSDKVIYKISGGVPEFAFRTDAIDRAVHV